MAERATEIDTIANTCIAIRFRILNRVITRIYDDALRPMGLKVSQLNILVVTAKLGSARPGRICELLHLDVSTLSRNADRMRAQGWIEFVTGKDARTHSFQLTAQGKRIIEKAIPAWELAQSKVTKLLGGEGVSVVNRLVKQLSETE